MLYLRIDVFGMSSMLSGLDFARWHASHIAWQTNPFSAAAAVVMCGTALLAFRNVVRHLVHFAVVRVVSVCCGNAESY
jgi:hypothetical protein